MGKIKVFPEKWIDNIDDLKISNIPRRESKQTVVMEELEFINYQNYLIVASKIIYDRILEQQLPEGVEAESLLYCTSFDVVTEVGGRWKSRQKEIGNLLSPGFLIKANYGKSDIRFWPLKNETQIRVRDSDITTGVLENDVLSKIADTLCPNSEISLNPRKESLKSPTRYEDITSIITIPYK